MRLAALVSVVSGAYGVLLAAEEALPSWGPPGIMGLIIGALVVTKQLVPGWIYAEKNAECIAKTAEITGLYHQIFETQAQTLPVLQASNAAVTEAMAVIRDRRRD